MSASLALALGGCGSDAALVTPVVTPQPAAVAGPGCVAAADAGATIVEAPPEMEAAWEKRWPMSRTAELAHIARIDAPAGARLVAVDDRGAVVDDGATAWRASAGTVTAIAPGRAAIGSLVWARDGSVVGLASDGLVSITPALRPSPGRALRTRDDLWFTSRDQLVRYRLATRTTSAVAHLGKDYEGALATDGRDVIVGDRDAIWKWDVIAGRAHVVTRGVYWPGDVAAHGATILADSHGHGATLLGADGAPHVSVGSGLLPTGGLGWVGDSAVFVGSLPAFKTAAAVHAWTVGDSTSGDDEADWLDGRDAILCWRSDVEPADPDPDAASSMRVARERRLYVTARGDEICELRTTGAELAWIEISRTEDCNDATHRRIVTAHVTGTCE